MISNEKEVLQKIGAKLRDLRVAKGYSSHETFAYDHDISRAHYWKLEAGRSNLTIRSLIKVLNIHGISLQEFFSKL